MTVVVAHNDKFMESFGRMSQIRAVGHRSAAFPELERRELIRDDDRRPWAGPVTMPRNQVAPVIRQQGRFGTQLVIRLESHSITGLRQALAMGVVRSLCPQT